MTEQEANESSTLHLKGIFCLTSIPSPAFDGLIKRGLRLLFSASLIPKTATSSSFIHDFRIGIGESRTVEIVINSPKSIGKLITSGEVYYIGYPSKAIGNFKVVEIVGKWEEKVP